MTVRTEVADLAALGSLPDKDAEEAVIARYQVCLSEIRPPVSDEEAALLIGLFGPDECYGLAWTLLHLIESAPSGPPLASEPSDDANEWLRRLWARSHRNVASG